MPHLEDRVLDLGLNVLDTEATHMYLCSAEPTTYASATATSALGNKNWGAGSVFGSPASASPNGRKVTSAVVSDGTVTGTGTAGFWAATDNTGGRLLAAGALSATQGVTSGNSWTLTAFDVRIPGQ